MRMTNYAQREMTIAWPNPDGMQEAIMKDILELIMAFEDQGHSGTTGSYTLGVFDRLARFKPITPITGEDDEWGTPYGADKCQQNRRCSSVFRENFDNSTAYDIEGKIFSDDGGKTFYSCLESRIPVSFPYYPQLFPEEVIRNKDEKESKDYPEIVDEDIKTVEDLIKVLQKCPKDMRVVYDYGLPVTLSIIDEDIEQPALNIS